MKIENSNNHTYLLGTITEIGNTIGSIIEKDWKNDKEFSFPKFCFATLDDYDYSGKTLEKIAVYLEGWHGCESVPNSFESSDMATILADYCGGGAVSAGSLWLDELDKDTVGDVISTIMVKTLEMDETANKDSVVLVESALPLPIRSDEELAQLHTKYEKFKLQWMINHGYTLESLVSSLAASLEDSDESLVETYDIWEEEGGFGGEIWPCFDEWLDNEEKEEN